MGTTSSKYVNIPCLYTKDGHKPILQSIIIYAMIFYVMVVIGGVAIPGFMVYENSCSLVFRDDPEQTITNNNPDLNKLMNNNQNNEDPDNNNLEESDFLDSGNTPAPAVDLIAGFFNPNENIDCKSDLDMNKITYPDCERVLAKSIGFGFDLGIDQAVISTSVGFAIGMFSFIVLGGIIDGVLLSMMKSITNIGINPEYTSQGKLIQFLPNLAKGTFKKCNTLKSIRSARGAIILAGLGGMAFITYLILKAFKDAEKRNNCSVVYSSDDVITTIYMFSKNKDTTLFSSSDTTSCKGFSRPLCLQPPAAISLISNKTTEQQESSTAKVDRYVTIQNLCVGFLGGVLMAFIILGMAQIYLLLKGNRSFGWLFPKISIGHLIIVICIMSLFGVALSARFMWLNVQCMKLGDNNFIQIPGGMSANQQPTQEDIQARGNNACNQVSGKISNFLNSIAQSAQKCTGSTLHDSGIKDLLGQCGMLQGDTKTPISERFRVYRSKSAIEQMLKGATDLIDAGCDVGNLAQIKSFDDVLNIITPDIIGQVTDKNEIEDSCSAQDLSRAKKAQTYQKVLIVICISLIIISILSILTLILGVYPPVNFIWLMG